MENEHVDFTKMKRFDNSSLRLDDDTLTVVSFRYFLYLEIRSAGSGFIPLYTVSG